MVTFKLLAQAMKRQPSTTQGFVRAIYVVGQRHISPRRRFELALVAAGIGTVTYQVFTLDFWINQYYYGSIVQQVKSSSLKVGEDREWKITQGLWGPKLQPYNPPPIELESSSGKVIGSREAKGYTVSIVTSDRGHFGFFGYVFSDARSQILPDGHIQIGYPFERTTKQLNQHWWVAENRSQ